LDNFQMQSVCDIAHQKGIPVHLDGARIFNASVSLGIHVTELVQHVDDLTFCVSKGLSAPVGSLVCGRADFIAEAKRQTLEELERDVKPEKLRKLLNVVREYAKENEKFREILKKEGLL